VEHGRPVILTDRIVATTRWGSDLQHRPGVYVAGNTADVMGIVAEVAQDTDFGRAVAVLTGAPDPM
jgi:DNA processing protein